MIDRHIEAVNSVFSGNSQDFMMT